jgi:hypothetical protein
MANVDDLEEGIEPFSVGNRGTTASRSARTNATKYDFELAAPRNPRCNDGRHQEIFAIPTKSRCHQHFHVMSALRQYRVLLHMLLKITQHSPSSSTASVPPGGRTKPPKTSCRKAQSSSQPSCSTGSSSAQLTGFRVVAPRQCQLVRPETRCTPFRRSNF